MRPHRMRTNATRSGFTLVELLVVIAIIGVLVALLLPAVQMARESANRSKCSNNVRQLALACHTFHDTFNYLPRGGGDGPDADCCNSKVKAGWSWAYHILPFIEQRNVYDIQGTSYSNTDTLVSRCIIPTFYCPSRRPPMLYGTSAKIDYAGNSGSFNDGANPTAAIRTNHGQDGVFVRTWKTLPVPGIPSGADLNTILPDNQRNFAAITDGLSNTLMFSEKQMHATTWSTNGGDNERWNNPGWDEDTVRFTFYTPEPDNLHPDENQPQFWSKRFGSSHPGGVVIARCDASVSLAPFTVDQLVWLNFGKIRDGQATNFDF